MALRDYMQDLIRTQNASEISLINDSSSSSIRQLGGSSSGGSSSFFHLGSSNHSNRSYNNNILNAGDIDFDGHYNGSFDSLSSYTVEATITARDDNPDNTDDNDSMGSEASLFFNTPEDTNNSDEVALIEGIRIHSRRGGGGGRRSTVRQMMQQLPSDDDGTNNDDELGLALQSFRNRHRRLRESLHNSSFHSPTNKLSPTTTTTSQSTPPSEQNNTISTTFN
jgi:hypothetical protein